MSVIGTTFAIHHDEMEDSKFVNAAIEKIKDTCFQKLADQVQPDTVYAIKLSRLKPKRVALYNGVVCSQDMSVDELGACYKCKFYGLDALTCSRTRTKESMTGYCSHFERRSNPVFID